jgi:hypothetical protein
MHSARLARCLTHGLWLSLLVLGACAHSPPPWEPHTLPGCHGSLGQPQLDQERTYLAAMLALSARHYAILHAEAPFLIEAESRTNYHPELFTTRWVMNVRPDGVLDIDAPSNDRDTHAKTQEWYRRLRNLIEQYQCRELAWLRAEATSAGLIAASAAPAPSSAGGETSVPVAATVTPEERAARQRVLDELHTQRRDVRLWRSVVWSAIGVVSINAGLATALRSNDASPSCADDPACASLHRNMTLSAGVGLMAAGGVVLAVSLPITLKRADRYRAINKELRLLQNPTLSLGGGRGAPAGLTFRANF